MKRISSSGITRAFRMRSSFSLTCSMITVALANALGRQTRPFASVDLVSRPFFVPFYPMVESIEANTKGGKVAEWDAPLDWLARGWSTKLPVEASGLWA